MYIMTEIINLVYNLFATPFFACENCNLDIKKLEKECLDFMSKTPSADFSNVGGYQGQDFENDDLFEFIKNNLPADENKPIKQFRIASWVNVNKQDNYNSRHHHDPHAGTFLSGVFYVKCPPDCGAIRFYDPRPHIDTAPDMQYFYDSKTHFKIFPQENMLLMFPSWLEHDVEPNKSKKERISISFNILDIEY